MQVLKLKSQNCRKIARHSSEFLQATTQWLRRRGTTRRATAPAARSSS